MAPNAKVIDVDDRGGLSGWMSPWDPKGPLSNEHREMVLEWIEQGIDFFGCDENMPKRLFEDALERLHYHPVKEKDLRSVDYAKLHDEFLESLLFEQSNPSTGMPSPEDLDTSSSLNLSASSSQCHSIATTTSSTTSSGNNDSHSSHNRGQKRSRPIKFHRRVMPALRGNESSGKREVSVSPSRGKRAASRSPMRREPSGVRVSLSTLKSAHYPAPDTYIHAQCRLQKDKGKGEPIGSNISAKGSEQCLEKLRQKMRLLTSVAFGEESSRKGQAEMKKRPARVSEILPNFTETRSILELRMGFLSMQYGILLRWDTSRTGKVTLVTLRKMCHESFYKKIAKPKPRSPPRQLEMLPDPASYSIQSVVDCNHAILQRPGGMEVALLEAPYKVDRPTKFSPSRLEVSLSYATGLSRKSNWTVQIWYEYTRLNLVLVWDADQSCHVPKVDEQLSHILPMVSSFDLSVLEINLFESRRRRKSRRCVATMRAPLHNLQPLQTCHDPVGTEVKLACATGGVNAEFTVSALLLSDFSYWLHREIEARRRDEVNGFVWTAPFRTVDLLTTEEAEDEEDVFDWLCCTC